MIKYIIVSDRPKLIPTKPERLVVSSADFIANKIKLPQTTSPKIINLCSNFDYLGKGYYVSLLAEARGLSCIPHISNIAMMNWKRNYEFAIPELNTLLDKFYTEAGEDPLTRTFTTFFGRHNNPKLEPLTRRLFDLFRYPVLTFEIKYSKSKKWAVTKIQSSSLAALSDDNIQVFQNALAKFTGSAWRLNTKNKKAEKYWIAILHNPEEEHTPSNPAALQKFIKVGKQLGVWVELITKNDFSMLLEYDALLIRETTATNNHTYRFAVKAAQEDIPCIDDTQSIIRCCNKVFLHELLQSHRIPVPETRIIDRSHKNPTTENMAFPVVLKIPDGSFSHGVFKARNTEEFTQISTTLLKKSEVIVCQEFVESEFDWRIGVLGGKPIFALKYFMAKGHWQIHNPTAKKSQQKYGAHKNIPIEDVPQAVLYYALKSANLVGDGLYGVDLKEKSNKEVVVIEVNDNPNIDSGVEDKLAGDELYKNILRHLIQKIDN